MKELEATSLGTLVSIQERDGKDVLTIDIGPLEIPQYPVAKVNRIERVEIVVVENDIPTVLCREDFPIVPHLNVFPDGEKTLCLFDVSFEDVKYMLFRLSLRQIAKNIPTHIFVGVKAFSSTYQGLKNVPLKI